MAQQIDNSVPAFARSSAAFPAVAAGVFTAVALVAGLVIALAAGSVPMLLLLGLALGGLAAFAYLGSRQTRRAAAERTPVDWTLAAADLQRAGLNIEVRNLARVLDAVGEQLNDVRSAYIVAEDLALRRIQSDEDSVVVRHIGIGGTSFDALYIRDEVVVCIEVAFLVTPELPNERIDAALRKIAAAGKAVAASGVAHRLRLMFVLITQLLPVDEDHLRTLLTRSRFAETPVDVDIRLLDFEELQQQFLAD